MKLFKYILFCTFVLSQTQVGTTAADILGIGVGSRALGMGGAYSSIANGPGSIYWNPGSISRFQNDMFLMSNVSWLLDTNLYFSTYIKKLDSNKSLGIYWIYLDYGEEPIYTNDDSDGTGLFWDASDLILGLTYGMNLTDRFSFGGSIKYINLNIHNESASNLAIDAGLIYKNNNTQIGMSISNIGFDMKLSGSDLIWLLDMDTGTDGDNPIPASIKTDYFPIPIFYRMGISSTRSIIDNVNLISSVDFVIPSDDVEHLNLGFEISYFNRAFFRCGYREIGNSSSEQGLTLGLGTNLYVFGLDICLNYAYQDFGILGYIPHFDFEFNF